jgi:hypothetical protein
MISPPGKRTLILFVMQTKAKRHQRISDLKGKQKAFIAKVKVSRDEDKKSRLKNRIYKHQEKIAVLEDKLSKT